MFHADGLQDWFFGFGLRSIIKVTESYVAMLTDLFAAWCLGLEQILVPKLCKRLKFLNCSVASLRVEAGKVVEQSARVFVYIQCRYQVSLHLDNLSSSDRYSLKWSSSQACKWALSWRRLGFMLMSYCFCQWQLSSEDWWHGGSKHSSERESLLSNSTWSRTPSVCSSCRRWLSGNNGHVQNW